MIRRTLAARIARHCLVLATVVLVSCGGGDEDETSITLNRFLWSTTTLTPPGSGTVPVRIDFGASSQTYADNNTQVTLSAYLVPTASTASSIGPTNRLALLTCPRVSFLCGSRDCTFASNRLLQCGSEPGLLLQPGGYTAVGRACLTNKSNVEVCAEARVPLTVN